jgi:hypothetical protein
VSRGPAWMKTFGSAIVAMCATVEAMNGQVAALQHRLNHHIDTSNRRLNTIERRLGIEVLLSAGKSCRRIGCDRVSFEVLLGCCFLLDRGWWAFLPWCCWRLQAIINT